MQSKFIFLIVCLFVQFQTHAQKVKTHESVVIGGINQWIGTNGKDASKPLLLFVHGGPGFSSRGYSKKFIKYLHNDFIVAQWDQRETGITAHWGPYKDSLSLELFYNDLEEVVEYLLQKCSKEKLYLVGFSWGGHLGFQLARNRPELLHAYIPVSAMIHSEESQQLSIAQLMRRPRNGEI